MENPIDKVHQGILLDEEEDLTLVRLCNFCNVSPDQIIELVNEGILDPHGHSAPNWKFSFTSVERVRKADRLQRDFELNISGVGLVLHLLDRIEQMERLLKNNM